MRVTGCSRGKRPLSLGKATTWKLAGHYAAVVRGERVTVYDLRARAVTVRGTAEGRVRQLSLLADGHSAWLAGDGGRRSVVVDGRAGVGQRGLTSVGFAGGVLLVGHGAYRGALGRGRPRRHAGAQRARPPQRPPRQALRRQRRAAERAARRGLQRRLLDGRRRVRPRMGDRNDGLRSRTTGRRPRLLRRRRRADARHRLAESRDALYRRTPSRRRRGRVPGRVACVAEDDAVTRIDADSQSLERFSRADTTLRIGGGSWSGSTTGQARTGPLPGAAVCGPASAKTLGQSPQARVYDRSRDGTRVRRRSEDRPRQDGRRARRDDGRTVRGRPSARRVADRLRPARRPRDRHAGNGARDDQRRARQHGRRRLSRASGRR